MDELQESFDKERFVIVSNRLPIVIDDSGVELGIKPASGGLITALNPLLKKRGGVWVGWPGKTDIDKEDVATLFNDYEKTCGYQLEPVSLTQEEVDLFYAGFSNEVIWPLFHDLQSECHFRPPYWEGYKEVNRKFAKHLAAKHQQGDFIWIHDYHLMLAADYLRKEGVQEKLTFFLHTPFAPLDIFMKIPWRFEILRAMLDYDYVGFQAQRDLRNFLDCIHALLPDISISRFANHAVCQHKEREVYVGVFPISIDFDEFFLAAKSPEVEGIVSHLKNSLNHRKIIFSVDRLDYIKGIPQRLDGIKRFLEKYPEMHGKVTFVQLVVPSRTQISEYCQLKEHIDREVSEINSLFTKKGWVPIHYMFFPLSREELVAYYRSADAILVSSIKDGMNLVAKEYVAANVDEQGVVILSEFAGAACQLRDDAILINPYDVEGLADSIAQALRMPLEERRSRMRSLRNIVRENDIYRWISQIVLATHSDSNEDIPVSGEYIPHEKS